MNDSSTSLVTNAASWREDGYSPSPYVSCLKDMDHGLEAAVTKERSSWCWRCSAMSKKQTHGAYSLQPPVSQLQDSYLIRHISQSYARINGKNWSAITPLVAVDITWVSGPGMLLVSCLSSLGIACQS